MEKSTVQLTALMKTTATQMAQTLLVDQTIFNVPTVKIAFQQHGNGKFHFISSTQFKMKFNRLCVCSEHLQNERNQN